MASSPSIRQIFVTGRTTSSMKLLISLYHSSLGKITDTTALIDSSATGNFVTRNHWPKERLTTPLYANNKDGSPNKNSMIQFHTKLTLCVGEKEETRWFHIIHLGNDNLILGLPWLHEANPIINWSSRKIHLPDQPNIPCHDSPDATYQRYLAHYLWLDPNEKLEEIHIQKLCHILVTAGIKKMTISTDIACHTREAK